MTKTAIITGVTGQDGSYMANLLLTKGYKVYGLIRRHSNSNFENLKFFGIHNNIELLMGDLTDEASINHHVKTIRPDEIYNFGAQSFVGISWEINKSTTEINSIGVLNLLNAIKNYSPSTRFYQASSSEMFGNSGQSINNESTPFHPRSPYGVSKLYSYWITVNFRESYSIHASNGIAFNHESPLRGKEFVTRKVTDGVARIKLGLADKIKLGNLEVARDWGFAGDYVEAAWRMLQQKEPDDYVIATGKTHTIKELLTRAFDCVGISDWSRYIEIDPMFSRPAELYSLCGDSSKALTKLGWSHTMDFDALISNMVVEDIKRLEK